MRGRRFYFYFYVIYFSTRFCFKKKIANFANKILPPNRQLFLTFFLWKKHKINRIYTVYAKGMFWEKWSSTFIQPENTLPTTQQDVNDCNVFNWLFRRCTEYATINTLKSSLLNAKLKIPPDKAIMKECESINFFAHNRNSPADTTHLKLD